jgi:hypothetical protein
MNPSGFISGDSETRLSPSGGLPETRFFRKNLVSGCRSVHYSLKVIGRYTARWPVTVAVKTAENSEVPLTAPVAVAVR